jgi:type IV pilus assembly protein PilQ
MVFLPNAKSASGAWARFLRHWGLPLALVMLAACQHSEPGKPPTRPAPAPAKAAPTPPPVDAGATNQSAAKPAKEKESNKIVKAQDVQVSKTYDGELREIISLARRNQWEEAESRASALYALDPKDGSVQRVYNWVKTEGPKRREKALEDKIRDVASQDTRFNPTIKSILTDKKTQGLPPRSDLRDAIEQIKATPYIPDTFGKTIQGKGAMNDYPGNQGKMSALLNKEIEVHLDNVTLEQIIFNVGKAEDISFIADKTLPAFQQKLSINAKGMRMSEFLSYVSRNMGLQFQIGGDLIWITDGKDTNKINLETRFYPLRRGLVLPAQLGSSDISRTTNVYAPANVAATTTVTEAQKFSNFVRDGAMQEPAVEAAIRKFFGGKYQVDREHNIVVAKGTEEQLKVLEDIIKDYDKPIQQVLIEARFITVTEPMFLRLGVAWETGKNVTTGRSPTDNTGLVGDDNVGLGLQETWYGILGRESLSATLTAIDQSGESQTISAPRVTLINNLPATISDGKIQYYYEQYTVAQTVLQSSASSSLVPLGSPTNLTSGVILDVLASIGGDGKSVNLALRPKVTADVVLKTFATISAYDSEGKVASTFDIKLPQLSEQSLSTRVVVKSGQTVVMGGVNQRLQKTYVESVPVLGNLPLIGAAFRRRTEIDQPRYLLVFVTATILSDSGENVISSDAE